MEGDPGSEVPVDFSAATVEASIGDVSTFVPVADFDVSANDAGVIELFMPGSESTKLDHRIYRWDLQITWPGQPEIETVLRGRVSVMKDVTL